MNDHEILYMIRQRDEVAYEIMVAKYQRLIWSVIGSILNCYHPKGVEKVDLFQEGLISLDDAINAYRDDIKAPFYSFALLCIQRQIKTYIRKYNGMTTRQFYNSVSLDMCISEDENLYVRDTISQEKYGRCSFLIQMNDQLKGLLQDHVLNQNEKRILLMKLQGFSYKEIATHVGCSLKYVDNTIQKIKKRIYVCN